MPKSINKRLRLAILEQGRPDYELAADLGISPSLLSHVVTGRRKPDRALCRRISELLGHDPEELFPREFLEIESNDLEERIAE